MYIYIPFVQFRLFIARVIWSILIHLMLNCWKSGFEIWLVLWFGWFSRPLDKRPLRWNWGHSYMNGCSLEKFKQSQVCDLARFVWSSWWQVWEPTLRCIQGCFPSSNLGTKLGGPRPNVEVGLTTAWVDPTSGGTKTLILMFKNCRLGFCMGWHTLDPTWKTTLDSNF